MAALGGGGGAVRPGQRDSRGTIRGLLGKSKPWKMLICFSNQIFHLKFNLRSQIRMSILSQVVKLKWISKWQTRFPHHQCNFERRFCETNDIYSIHVYLKYTCTIYLQYTYFSSCIPTKKRRRKQQFDDVVDEVVAVVSSTCSLVMYIFTALKQCMWLR